MSAFPGLTTRQVYTTTYIYVVMFIIEMKNIHQRVTRKFSIFSMKAKLVIAKTLQCAYLMSKHS